jgi:apolipoprotein N-acyltransferase
MQMEDIKDKTVDLADHVEDLADTFYKLTVLKATQKATNITSATVATIVVCTFGFLVLLFSGLALSWWLGNLLENRAAGFLLGAVFFLIVMIILVLLRKKIVFPFIRDLIIRKLYD